MNDCPSDTEIIQASDRSIVNRLRIEARASEELNAADSSIAVMREAADLITSLIDALGTGIDVIQSGQELIRTLDSSVEIVPVDEGLAHARALIVMSKGEAA